MYILRIVELIKEGKMPVKGKTKMRYDFKKTRYIDENNKPTRLALLLYVNDELYGRLTTNIEDGVVEEDEEYIGYLDVNNAMQYLYLLDGSYEILGGTPSGFVVYPKVRFNKDFIDRLEEYDGK